ncbi:MAG TPA: limonene-1,2-epoxide hydrolase family protein [Acidimicrobiales bacterium]|nr:limonene-1,2-epoxide hydrolase family protein [Acidimicrobiales bacterium]
MPSPEEVVREFCAAARSRDPQVLRGFLSEDVVYHNIPMEPAVGIEAAMAVIDMFVTMCEALDFEVHHLAVDGETVLTERTDTFTINGKTAPLPVMGAFRVVGGKITAWRDYFDMAQVTAIFSQG